MSERQLQSFLTSWMEVSISNSIRLQLLYSYIPRSELYNYDYWNHDLDWNLDLVSSDMRLVDHGGK